RDAGHAELAARVELAGHLDGHLVEDDAETAAPEPVADGQTGREAAAHDLPRRRAAAGAALVRRQVEHELVHARGHGAREPVAEPGRRRAAPAREARLGLHGARLPLVQVADGCRGHLPPPTFGSSALTRRW